MCIFEVNKTEFVIMEKLIAAFPQNIFDSLNMAKKLEFKKPISDIHNIVFVGMGGSGIGAKIVAQWIQDEVEVPVLIFQDYTLPKFINENTLLIACSYSGNTEETLFSFEQAKNQGAHIIGITSGGSLEKMCKENDYDCIVIPGGNPPRSSIAFSVVHISNILVKLGLVSDSILFKLEKSASLILENIESIKNEAKNLSSFLKDKTGIFYSTSEYEPLLIRARQQFNENSKVLCLQHTIPEMNHNELVGWAGGTNDFAVVFFDTKDLSIQNKKRFEVSIEVVKKHTSSVSIIESLGQNSIERTLYLMHLIDWASFYLSELNGVDIMDIKVIDYLKSELSKLA
jgi:glucose/mannose-6-phosphate isomerase